MSHPSTFIRYAPNQSPKHKKLAIAQIRSHASKIRSTRTAVRESAPANLLDQSTSVRMRTQASKFEVLSYRIGIGSSNVNDSLRTHEPTNEGVQHSGEDSHEPLPDAPPFPPLHTAITQSKRDPFSPEPVANMPTIFHDFEDYTYKTCERMNEYNWRQEAANHPAVNCANLMTITQQAAVKMHDPRLQKQFAIHELRYKQMALQLIRSELSKPSSDVSDGLIIAVLILAVHDGNFNSTWAPEVHPTSLIASDVLLQDMGRNCPRLEHAQALLALLNKKGGTQNVQFRGIDQIMLLLQFLVFAWHDVRLLVPLFKNPSDRPLLNSDELYPTHPEAQEMCRVAGSGFDIIREMPGLRALHQCLIELRDLTVALDQFHRGDQSNERWQTLVLAHGVTQQRLLYMPEKRILEPGPQGWGVYRICLLSALLYSDMIISPLPIVTGLKPRLAAELRQALTVYGEPDLHYGGIILWAMLLGCIAATYTEDRTWYLTEVRRQVDRLGIKTFEAFKALMITYLWYDPVLNQPTFRAFSESITILS